MNCGHIKKEIDVGRQGVVPQIGTERSLATPHRKKNAISWNITEGIGLSQERSVAGQWNTVMDIRSLKKKVVS
jgi:hypothetical protein